MIWNKISNKSSDMPLVVHTQQFNYAGNFSKSQTLMENALEGVQWGAIV
jgi:hypothetical protein